MLEFNTIAVILETSLSSQSHAFVLKTNPEKQETKHGKTQIMGINPLPITEYSENGLSENTKRCQKIQRQHLASTVVINICLQYINTLYILKTF